MSRLDDELKLALARKEPSADFADRLFARVAARQSAKAGWWERLLSYSRAPRIGWIAVGAAAVLLIAIVANQYKAPVLERAEPGPTQANVGGAANSVNPDTADEQQRAVASTSPGGTKNGESIAPGSQRNDRARQAQLRKEQQLKAEGEAAKQQLILALQIASTTFNDALREGVKAARIRPALVSRS